MDPNTAPARGKRPTVLQVLPALETGGVETGAVDVARALVDAGWRALVASEGGTKVYELDKAGGEHVKMPLATKNLLKMRANASALARLIRAEGVDLVHARSRAPAWSALWAARRTGTPFVTTFHGTYNFGTGLGPLNPKLFYNSVMTRGDRVIAISRFIAEHMKAHYGFDWAKVRIVPRGIDLRRFDPLSVTPERIIKLARDWRLPDDAPVVMLPGRLTRWKGQTVMIEALAKLKRPEVRLVLVGSDQGRTAFREELVQLSRQLGVEGQVHIVDDCRDMPAAYMVTDVVVSASTDPEAFGRVVVEGQAMGRPVIGTDHGGSQETILRGETGWLVPPADAGALAASVEAALRMTADERGAVAWRAVEHVRESYSKARMCDATIAIYRELLDR